MNDNLDEKKTINWNRIEKLGDIASNKKDDIKKEVAAVSPGFFLIRFLFNCKKRLDNRKLYVILVIEQTNGTSKIVTAFDVSFRYQKVTTDVHRQQSRYHGLLYGGDL